jgi:hypothetical protein
MSVSTSLDIQELFKMSREQLDQLFANSPPGAIPNGETNGTALISPGTVCTKEIAECLRLLAWQGKVFDAEKGCLKNRVTAFGIKAVDAKVYKAPSFFDNKECIVIDYSALPLVQWVRDEIRLIAPQLYLGKVYWAKKPLPVHFALESVQQPTNTPHEKNG